MGTALTLVGKPDPNSRAVKGSSNEFAADWFGLLRTSRLSSLSNEFRAAGMMQNRSLWDEPRHGYQSVLGDYKSKAYRQGCTCVGKCAFGEGGEFLSSSLRADAARELPHPGFNRAAFVQTDGWRWTNVFRALFGMRRTQCIG